TSRPLMVRKSMYKDTNIRLKVASFNCPEEVSLTFRWFLKYYPCHNEYINVDEMYDRTPLSRGRGYGTPTLLDKGTFLTQSSVLQEKDDVIVTTWRDGPYLLVTQHDRADWFKGETQNCMFCIVTVNVVMKGAHGFISVTEWPLMIFYMVMCIVYILYALLWFIWASCYWKDLLRIQFWIAGVIFLGMVEMAVFCAEFENTNAVGSASQGLLVFAELISALKRTLARLLVIIVSLGYGIVKSSTPTGPPQSRYDVGGSPSLPLSFMLVFFSLLSPSFPFPPLHLLSQAKDSDWTCLLANFPWPLLDSSLCWWISFWLTPPSHKPYKDTEAQEKPSEAVAVHDSASPITLIFAGNCLYHFHGLDDKEIPQDWMELWVDDAFWRFLFSIILLVIMFLWRPSANNQRRRRDSGPFHAPNFVGQFGDGPFLFQHDRTPVHRASSIKTWRSESGVEELDWPAQSPDLHPIEHLWDGLERRLRARPSHPTSVSDLTHVLLEEWYAFTPLIDDSDDEEIEEFLVSANISDGIKLRAAKAETNGTAKPPPGPDEDLKWVEENIPSSLTDVALPVLLDSDEEIMTTKYEMSKME
ncbi:hypothetical protein NFI96_022226, partial [Prochilodus magdalenae]